MGLEEKISDEEIRRSFQLRQRRTLLAKLVGITSGALSFYTLEQILALPGPLFNATWSAALGFTLYAATTTFSLQNTLFHESKKLSLFLDAFYTESGLEKRLPGLISFCEDTLRHTKDPLQRRLIDIELDFLQGNSTSALQKSVHLCQSYEYHHYRGNLIERLNRRFKDFLFSHSVLRNSAPANIEFALHHLGEGDTVLAEKRFRHAASQSGPLQIPVHCLVAYYFDTLAKHTPHLKEEAQHQWERTIGILLQTPSLVQQFRRLGESRNEVFELSGEGILKDTFVFKRNPSQPYLAREFALTKYLRTVFQDNELVAEPLAFLSMEDSHYLVLRRVPGVPLRERFSDGNPVVILQDIFPTLAAFHAQLDQRKGTVPQNMVGERDYHTFLDEKYARRMPPTNSPRFSQALAALADTLNQQQRYLIHGDLHPENILVSPRGFTIIDPEHMVFASRHLDLAALLEDRAVVLDETQLEKVLQSYYATTDSQDSFEQFVFDYSYGGFFEDLRLQGSFAAYSYGLDAQALAKTKEHYKTRAALHLARIRTLDSRQKDTATLLEGLIVA